MQLEERFSGKALDGEGVLAIELPARAPEAGGEELLMKGCTGGRLFADRNLIIGKALPERYCAESTQQK